MAASPFCIQHTVIQEWSHWCVVMHLITILSRGHRICACGGWAPVNWDPWWTIWDGGLCFICCIHAPRDKGLLWEVIFWASWGVTSMKSSSLLQLAFLEFDSAAPAGGKKMVRPILRTENKPNKRDTNQCDYILFTYVTFCIKCPSHTFWSNSESLSQHLQ